MERLSSRAKIDASTFMRKAEALQPSAAERRECPGEFCNCLTRFFDNVMHFSRFFREFLHVFAKSLGKRTQEAGRRIDDMGDNKL